MKTLIGILITAGALLISSCGATSQIIDSVVLPTSGTRIDTVQHRSSTFDGCAELVVIQTFDAFGRILDSQAGRGRTLPCTVVEVGIEAGSRVGSAAIIGNALVKAAKATQPDTTNVSAVNSASASASASASTVNSQQQTQGQHQKLYNKGVDGPGHNSGGNTHGNNGGGNGDGDGTNPGTGHHHGNGDNN